MRKIRQDFPMIKMYHVFSHNTYPNQTYLFVQDFCIKNVKFSHEVWCVCLCVCVCVCVCLRKFEKCVYLGDLFR